MDNWFVLYCKSGKDGIAENNLLNQQFEVYRPRIRIIRLNKDRTYSTRCESLFPRYLFIRVNPHKCALSSITYTRGVAGFVKFGDRYPAIANTVINEIRACEMDQQRQREKTENFAKGDPIYINGGSFRDIKATFIERRSDNRVAVLLGMLGGTSMVDVPTTYISKRSAY